MQLEEMKGGTFTISNLGGIGGTTFTPIINYPEVAILGLSRARLQPVVREGQVVPRLLLPLSLSYDHRVIDGAAAARFTRRLAEMLEDPLQMVLYA
jgi:pyruvate dehydrogenase E2 component (dihydrolipoamide acetyltransferase)